LQPQFLLRSTLMVDQITEQACKEVETYKRVAGNGIQGLIVENMGDLPYLKVSEMSIWRFKALRKLRERTLDQK